jgi:surfeit locus 1 family protein
MSRRGLIVPALLTLAGVAILIALGVWQLQRKVWKEDLIATLTARLSAPAQPLPAMPMQGTDEFRHVRLHVSFIPGEAALVFTSGSALRPDVTSPGYWALSPARTDDGRTIVINRGFVADKTSVGPPPAGEVELTGALRWPEEGNPFTPADEPQHNLWYRRDPVAIAAAKGWGQVARFYVEQETPQLAGAPRVGPLVVNLRDNHLQYAITWFGLAAAFAAVYLVWLRGRLRRA